MKDTKKTVGIFVISALVIFLIDRFLKWYALEEFHTPIKVIGDFFRLVQSANDGIAFGIDLPFIVHILLVPVLLFVGCYYAIKHFRLDRKFTMITLGVIAGGAISNYADRLIYDGHVIDYISVWIWPVFNLADVAITLGIFTIVVFYGKISRV